MHRGTVPRRRLAASRVAAVLAVAVAGVCLGQVNLIGNGSFESPSDPPAPGTLLTIAPGQEASLGFSGWSVLDGDVQVIDASAPFLGGVDWSGQLIDGSQILDLSGTVPGTVTQSFPTTAGDTFRISLWYTNNPLAPGGMSAARVGVEDATLNAPLISPVLLLHGSATASAPNWSSFQFEFIAVGPLSRLVLLPSEDFTAPGPDGGMFFDAVSVTPEPAPAAALVALFAAARRPRGCRAPQTC